MDLDEQVIRRLEDFILHEHQLKAIGNLPFQYNGEERLAYSYIRASNGPLVAALRGLQQHLDRPPAELQFLEVGCGIGTKCELARGLGMQTTGIDLLPEYVNLANQVYPECKFITANALEFDYASFDLVYYHVPFFDDCLLQALEDRVLSQIRSGAVLIVTRTSQSLARTLSTPDSSSQDFGVAPVSVAAEVGRLVLIQKS